MQKFTEDRGAIDLPSVMVTAIIIGLLAILVSLKVIPLIPWAQDTAAKYSLSKVVDAQNAARIFDGNYVSEERLIELGLVSASAADKFETSALKDPWLNSEQATAESGNHFYAGIKSASGKYFLAHDGGETVENPTVQPAAGTMVTNWDTSIPGCTTITIPMFGVGQGSTIDWGDGVEEAAGDKPSHTYNTNGPVQVRFSGTFDKFSFYETVTDASNRGSSPCITSVGQWTGTKTTNLSGAFYLATSLTEVPQIPYGVQNIDTALGVTNFNGDVSQWDTSKVTSMMGTFMLTPFNQDLSSWDTSNVNNMQAMFAMTSDFNKPLNSWDVSKVKDFSGMFSMAPAFDQPLDQWDTSSAETMQSMFAFTDNFNQKLDTWDTSNVSNMSSIFSGTKEFNQDLTSWNTSRVTDLSNAFAVATKFNSPLGTWDTSKVTTMEGIFSTASIFDQDISDWDTSSVNSFARAFMGATKFDQDISRWDTSNATDMGGMFLGATSFNQNIGIWNTGKVQAMGSMFSGAHQFNQPIGTWNTSQVKNMNGIFLSAVSFDQNLSSWDVGKVEVYTSAFTGTPMASKTGQHPHWN